MKITINSKNMNKNTMEVIKEILKIENSNLITELVLVNDNDSNTITVEEGSIIFTLKNIYENDDIISEFRKEEKFKEIQKLHQSNFIKHISKDKYTKALMCLEEIDAEDILIYPENSNYIKLNNEDLIVTKDDLLYFIRLCDDMLQRVQIDKEGVYIKNNKSEVISFTIQDIYENNDNILKIKECDEFKEIEKMTKYDIQKYICTNTYIDSVKEIMLYAISSSSLLYSNHFVYINSEKDNQPTKIYRKDLLYFIHTHTFNNVKEKCEPIYKTKMKSFKDVEIGTTNAFKSTPYQYLDERMESDYPYATKINTIICVKGDLSTLLNNRYLVDVCKYDTDNKWKDASLNKILTYATRLIPMREKIQFVYNTYRNGFFEFNCKTKSLHVNGEKINTNVLFLIIRVLEIHGELYGKRLTDEKIEAYLNKILTFNM